MEDTPNFSLEKGKSKAKNNSGNTRFRRQNFSSQETFLLLRLLRELQVTSKRVDPSGNFTLDEWKIIHPLYNDKCNATKRSEDELRSRYKTVKKSFYLYKDLADRTGWSWNYIENLPSAPSKTSWFELIKMNSKYSVYQRKVFPWYKEMEELCGRNVASNDNNEVVNVIDSSNSRRVDEELDGFELNSTRNQELDAFELNSTRNQELDRVENNREDQIGGESEPPRAMSSSRKRGVEEIGGECESSKKKRKNSKSMENLLQKVIEQNERILEQQDARNAIFSQWVESRPDKVDPNEVCKEIMSKLSSNDINLGPNELTALVMALSNPWIRAVFMNVEGAQLRDWINNLLKPSNLISRMMNMDMDSKFRFVNSKEEERFFLTMMDDDQARVQVRSTNMLILSLMTSLKYNV